MKSVLLSILLILTITSVLLTAEDPGRGHFQSAQSFFQKNQVPQALEDLNTVVRSFPQSAYADDALMQLGIYYFEALKKPEEAATYFSKIKENYADSNSAPAAYLYLGRIRAASQNPASIEDAVAEYQRVIKMYPESEWADDALLETGKIHQLHGEFDLAYANFAQVRRQFPEGSAAAQAQFEMGMCSLNAGFPVEATAQFQTVLDVYPDSPSAKSSAEMNTILYRLYLAPSAEKSTYAADSAFSGYITDLDEPTGMAVDSTGNIYLSDKGKKSVYTFDIKGKLTNTTVAADPYSIAMAADDRLLIANETGVMFGKESLSFRSGTEYLEKIRSVAVNSMGHYFLVSDKLPGIQVYNEKRETLSQPALPKTLEFYRVKINSRNQILMLDKDRKRLLLFSPDGKQIFNIQPAGKELDYGKIEDFAFDRASNVYVLTDNPRGVLIFTPTGKLLKFIASVEKTSLSFEDGKAIAVGASGEVYVVDKDSKRIVKIG